MKITIIARNSSITITVLKDSETVKRSDTLKSLLVLVTSSFYSKNAITFDIPQLFGYLNVVRFLFNDELSIRYLKMMTFTELQALRLLLNYFKFDIDQMPFEILKLIFDNDSLIDSCIITKTLNYLGEFEEKVTQTSLFFTRQNINAVEKRRLYETHAITFKDATKCDSIHQIPFDDKYFEFIDSNFECYYFATNEFAHLEIENKDIELVNIFDNSKNLTFEIPNYSDENNYYFANNHRFLIVEKLSNLFGIIDLQTSKFYKLECVGYVKSIHVKNEKVILMIRDMWTKITVIVKLNLITNKICAISKHENTSPDSFYLPNRKQLIRIDNDIAEFYFGSDKKSFFRLPDWKARTEFMICDIEENFIFVCSKNHVYIVDLDTFASTSIKLQNQYQYTINQIFLKDDKLLIQYWKRKLNLVI
jgi:hypothetical protein